MENYQRDYSRISHLKVLEQTIKDSYKRLPRNYNKIKDTEEKIEFLEGKLFNSLLNRRAFYKLTEK